MEGTPTRSEFLFLPTWQIVLFYSLSVIATIALFAQVYSRIALWRKGRPIGWKPAYLPGVWKYVLSQRKVRTSRPKSGAPMHLLIFYGFLALFIGTTLLAVNTYSPWKFHKGGYYLTYEFVLDIMGLALLIGLIWAVARRSLARPSSLTTAPQDYATLALLGALTITGFILEAARMNVNPKPFDKSAPIGHWLSGYLPQVDASSYIGIWWTHSLLVFLFLAVLPQLRLRHILYAIFSSAGNPPQKMGELAPISIEQVEESGKIGASEAADYSRWHLMSLDACMECGRCTEVCPAWNVGKVLNPKHVVLDLRKSMQTGTAVAEAISDEAIWQCTTCNACVEACPVLIRHVDILVDARRALVAEGKLSGTGATMLRQTQSTGSAWGMAASDRENCMDESIPRASQLIARGETFEYLLWIGCAGSIDRAAINVNTQLSNMLRVAGVSFACLGTEERCTGDPARRTGDEFLFQELAQQNIATFEQYGVKKIVTACPHCFNTIRNEYPQFNGNYEVLHHSQLLSVLIRDGKLRAPSFDDGSVTMHDPCYLGRVNNETDAPRRALGVPSNANEYNTPIAEWLTKSQDNGNSIAEPKHKGRKTLCCGAGGGRMWMEEDADKRPSDRRTRELLATGAKTIAVACPFCRIMLDTSVGEQAQLLDIVELVAKSNQSDG